MLCRGVGAPNHDGESIRGLARKGPIRPKSGANTVCGAEGSFSLLQEGSIPPELIGGDLQPIAKLHEGVEVGDIALFNAGKCGRADLDFVGNGSERLVTATIFDHRRKFF